jgi:hypothetical protein
VRRVGPAWTLALGLLATALVVSRPLPSMLREGLPVMARAPADVSVLQRTPGDALQLYYQLWLFGDGLFGQAPFLHDPYQFRTDGARWNLPQTFPPLSIPFTLLRPLGSHVAYNLLVLLSFPAAGLPAYALARQLGSSRAGAYVAGIGFALLPTRLGPLFGGQPAGFATGLVPLVLWGLDVALTRDRLGGGLAGGGALLALATLEPHYAYLVGGIVLVYVPVRLATAPIHPRRVLPLFVFGLLAVVGAGWLLLLRQVFVLGSIADAGRRLEEVRLFSPGPDALRTPTVYGGAALGGLAAVGLVAGGRIRSLALRGLFGAAFAVGVVLGLGPTVPSFPLYQTLHRWAPLFAMIRNPEKFRLLTGLGAAILGAAGADALCDRLGRAWPRAAGALLAGFVLVLTPSWYPIGVARFADHPVYATLRAEARKVLYVPLWPGDSAWSSVYLYTVTRTHVPTVNGYSPFTPRAYVRDVATPLQNLNVGDLGPAEAERLRQFGVTHVVVDRSVYPAQVSPFPSAFTLKRLGGSPVLALEQAVDPLWLFRVTDRPALAATVTDAPTSPVGVFYEAEALRRETGRPEEDATASRGRVVAARAGTDRPGFLTFGPYRLLPAGAYRATFRVRGTGLTAQVATDRGRQVMAARLAPTEADWVNVVVPFALERAAPIELRLSWSGEGKAAADWMLVVFADRPQPEWSFAVADLPHLLGERPDPAASTGLAGYADPDESRRADLVAGPVRLYPGGRYRLTLRARAASAARGPFVRLSVAQPAGQVLATRLVDGAELPPGTYHDVSLDFTLPNAAVLEFPVGYLGGAGVFFDRVAIHPR